MRTREWFIGKSSKRYLARYTGDRQLFVESFAKLIGQLLFHLITYSYTSWRTQYLN